MDKKPIPQTKELGLGVAQIGEPSHVQSPGTKKKGRKANSTPCSGTLSQVLFDFNLGTGFPPVSK
jgi:hypothetical protein